MSTPNAQPTSPDSQSGTPPNSDPNTNPQDTTPGSTSGQDSNDLLSGDDTTKGAADDDGEPGDLLADDKKPDTATFGAEPVDIDAFKGEFKDAEWDDAQLGDFMKIVNGAGSRMEMAKQLVEFHEKVIADGAQQLSDQFNETVKGWQNEVAKHYGEGKDAALAKVKTFINNYADDPAATLAFFKSTGVSNNLHLIRLLEKAAEAVPGEARPAEGAPASNGASIADKMFPSTAQRN